MAQGWLLNQFIGAGLERIVDVHLKSWGPKGPIGGMQGALERLVQQMGRDRLIDDALPVVVPE
jgi:hypothetical protein